MADPSSQDGSSPGPRPRRRRPIPRPQVFISFRGVDVRSFFLRLFVTFLGSRKISWFTDTLLPVGENLEELFTEIEKSKIAVVIFSKRYPDSKWCMEELVKIDQRAKEGKLKVIPAYYKVNISDVKNLQGEFKESFERLKKEYMTKEPEKVKKWEEALESITKRKGLDSHIYSEAPLLNRIVDAVIACLNKMPGGKVKPVDNKFSIIDVIILAFVAALLCRFLISPMFFNNADFFNTGKWVFGFPVAVGIWFHINNGNEQNNSSPGTTKSTPSSTEPPSPPPPSTGPPPPGSTRRTPSNFKPQSPPPSFTKQTPSNFTSPPPSFTKSTSYNFKPPPPPPPPFSTKPTPFNFKPPPPPSFTKPTPFNSPSFTKPTSTRSKPPQPPPSFTKPSSSSFNPPP